MTKASPDLPARNGLTDERSPFLRHGATQPVDWRPWGDAAFREADELGRPVLLDIGAVWCHWCHVMDHESYEDEETAALINESFVPVKVDRDERPDVDARYQRAVQLLTGQGGWPLTAFLTPQGDVFYGGTYFPPVDAQGRPSFRRVLSEVARVWRDDRARADDAVRSIGERLEAYARSETRPGELSPGIVEAATEELAGTYDFRYGGFGRAPKFPNPVALEIMIDRFLDSGDDWARRIAVETLTAMGRGGIFDQIGGGFHRYSTDARWIIPHFEKMAYDNGPLLGTCAIAAAVFDDAYMAQIVDGIVDHYVDIASDLVESGGFPASQDADFGFDNDGDYWTWTEDELRAALPDDDAFELARLAWGFDDDAGRMHIDRRRHVLFRALDDGGLAEHFRIGVDEARARLEEARRALKAVRDTRPAPYVDTTLYSGWTALVASGHIAAARYLDRDAAGQAGLRALERLFAEAWTPAEGVLHRLNDTDSGFVLEDQAYVLSACVDAFELTQDSRWLERGRDIAGVLRDRFLDPESGALRDRPPGAAPVRALEQPLFPITDSPTPSGNGAAALALCRLAAMTEDAATGDLGRGVLLAFAGMPPGLLAASGTFVRAVDWAVNPVTHIVIVDDGDPSGNALLRAARKTYRPRTTVRFVAPDAAASASLPAAILAMLGEEHPRAYVCSGRTCAAPVSDAAALAGLIRSFNG